MTAIRTFYKRKKAELVEILPHFLFILQLGSYDHRVIGKRANLESKVVCNGSAVMLMVASMPLSLHAVQGKWQRAGGGWDQVL